MSSNSRLLASVLRVLALLWECQAAAHGAVDILRAQPDLWTGLKVSKGSGWCWCAGFWGPGPVGDGVLHVNLRGQLVAAAC
jgi:hypothetical protein